MQPGHIQNSRQRPLQKSMFLPQSEQYINRPSQVDYHYQDMMKRSSINPDTPKIHNFQFNQPNIQPQTPIQHYNTNSSSKLNFNTNLRYKQNPKQTQFEHLPQNPVNSQLTIHQLQQNINQLFYIVENHDQILKKNYLLDAKDKTPLPIQLQQIEVRIKESLLPTMISRQTKEIYEHIFSFKVQIKSLKQEISQINDKIKNEMTSFLEGNKKSSPTSNWIEKMGKSQDWLMDLGTNLNSLENRFLQMQKDLQAQNEGFRNRIMSQIEKGRKQIEVGSSSPNLRSSTIKSTLPPIMIEYLQIFGIKSPPQQNQTHTRREGSTSLSPEANQIILNSTTYHIDREGYLLDSQNRYIVDAKGHQIKLDQKHLSLLKDHHLLT